MIQKSKAQYHGLPTIYIENFVARLPALQTATRKKAQNKGYLEEVAEIGKEDGIST